MQFIVTPSGDEIAIMRAEEVLTLEGALSLYVMKNPNSNIAVRALREVSSANESRMERMEAEVERASSDRS
ncbi:MULTISPECIES: hypothetical protein [Streptomyces]|uniref:Uncharacterized protein n=1 Tax=Streptomyces parvus TaxID=66428 RepID=A0A7K3S2S4_9ACTN|nr:hypothetical protein [Streptomyces parvus]NEC21800.1 hypothetical protein [Streptomyces parvus]NEC23458.1 hypothetical protein [Streptomyces parvus]